jgi:hypothetical protein
MITLSCRTRPRSRKPALAALAALATALLVSACASGTSAASGSTSASSSAAAASAQACQQVDAVLSDGPDPDADPVGYAQAQILPLLQISTADATLHKAIGGLAAAYSSYSSANGTSKAATATLKSAIAMINSLCPDAGASV